MEHMMQLALMMANGILTLVVTYAGWKLKKYHDAELEHEKKDAARDKLILCNSRISMMREFNRYLEKGYAPIYAVDSLTEMYEAYHAFGGNGAMTSLYDEFMKLPHVSPEDRK